MRTVALNLENPISNSVTANTWDVDVNTDRLLIGQGFNSITGKPGGMSVVYNGREDLTTAATSAGQIVSSTYEEITSLEQLKDRLNISAAATFGFGIFSADVTFEFLRSGSYSQYNSFIFLDVVVRNPAEVLKRPVATMAALERAEKGKSLFLDFCGNSYVYGRQTGGQLTAIVQFSSEFREDYEHIRTEVSASVGAFARGEVSIDRAMLKLNQLSRQRVHILRRGGLGPLPTVNELAEAARSFPTSVTVTANPVVVSMLTREYNSVENLSSSVIDLQLLEHQARTLDVIASYVTQAYAVRGELKFILENPGLFDYSGDLPSDIGQAFKNNETIIQALFNEGVELRNDPLRPAPKPPELPVLKNIKRKPKPQTIPPPPLPPPQPIVELYENENFGGRSINLLESCANLADLNFNDTVSSFRVNGTAGQYEVEFFRDANYQNRIYVVQSPTQVNNLHDIRIMIPGQVIPFKSNLSDIMSSVKIARRA